MKPPSTILFTKKLTNKQKNILQISIDNFDFIRINPIDFTCSLSSFQTLIFTSQNAVKQVVNKIKIPVNQRIYVVGNKTKQSLLNLQDFKNIYQPEKDENAGGIIQLIEAHNTDDFIYFCGTKRVPTLEKYLKENAKKHQLIEVYDTCLSPTLGLDITQYEYLCFCSPSAVESYLSTYKIFPKHKILCIGKTTASVLRNYTKNIEIAPQASVESMLHYLNEK